MLFIKNTTLLFCLFFITTIVFGQNIYQKNNFDGDWKFHFGNASNPEKDFNYGISNLYTKSGAAIGTCIDPKYKDSAWQNIQLPHDWAVSLPFVEKKNFDVMSHGYKPVGGLFPETSIGWYRKHFTINKKDIDNKFYIQFDGMYRDATIWVNGFFVGNNKSGYVGITYDISDFLNFDKENIITVRVDATQYEGWFYEGAGIYRHVWLIQKNKVHIKEDGIFIHTKTINNNANIYIENAIVNRSNIITSCTIENYITNRNGEKIKQLKSKQISIKPNETYIIKNGATVLFPKLWSIENPYLYRVVSVLKQNGKVVDSFIQKFGIRNIDIKPNGVFLNGKHIKILGTNNHQDHAGLGSALPDYLQYYRIALLKEMGVNAYRTSHNAPTPELLDACDSLGMLVMDEQRLLNSSDEYINQFDRLLLRDRSRASVFMWSIGNEEGWIHTTEIGKKIAQTFITKQQQLDPTRTCTYAADVANVYTGINEVIPVRSFNYRQYAVADYHKDHPTQPILGTEMGSTVTTRGIYEKDSSKAYVPDQDITAPWWASTAETWWKLAANNDAWLGGFIWTGFDYRGEPTPYEWPNINSHFGVMDMCGFPKNIYYYYQSWWTNNDVLHLSPHWNWKGKEGLPIDVWVNSNADNVELFLDGKSLGKKEMPSNSHLQWNVIYEPGKLEAIAYKKGKKIITSIQTTDVANKIICTKSKLNMKADGKDAMVINVHIVDKNGLEVPTANNLIHFSVEGEGKIIGVGNGDPSSHEADKCEEGTWQRRLFNGKCQIIIQAAKKIGNIKLIATADNLREDVTEIVTN
jgi:beta-galactosidase